MTSRAELERQVELRAAGRCEYCRMHQTLQVATFHLEHAIPKSHGGATDLENLAWACPTCNLRKSNRIDVTDADTGAAISLFNPRSHSWHENFAWDEYQIAGLTAIGRATVAALDLQSPAKNSDSPGGTGLRTVSSHTVSREQSLRSFFQ